nr:serine hydrolase domain-containing protein [uncultured Dyadobacter sp.]
MKVEINKALRIAYVSLVILTCSCGERDPKDIKNTITTYQTRSIDNGFLVGTAIAFYDNGKEDYFCYGFSDTTRKHAITRQSVFEIGSISKTFTALLLADLVQKGKIKLDDPAERYLPDSIRMPFVGDRKITLADLSSHTSGLPRMPDNFTPKDSTNPYTDYSVKDMYAFVDSIRSRKLTHKYEYSNLGVGLLGVAETNFTGKSYEALIQQIICKPLGMEQTSTLNTSRFLTTGHVATYPVNHWDLDAMAGAGGIRSSAEDLMRYLKAQMGVTRTELLPAMKLTQKPLHHVNERMKVGLGWHFAFANGDTIITHSGGTGGYRTFAAFNIKAKKAIVILNNSTYSPDEAGMYFFDQKTRIPPVKSPVNVPLEVLEEKAGTYKITSKHDFIKPGSVFSLKVHKGQLQILLSGTPKVDLFPESSNTFFSKTGQTIVFTGSAKAKNQTVTVYFPMGIQMVGIKEY